MPNWKGVLQEIEGVASEDRATKLATVRYKYLDALSQHTGRTVIAYYSGWFTSPPSIAATQINDDDKNGFMLCVHGLSKEQKESGLDLILHTPGGNMAATHSLIHYLKSIFGCNIRAIVPQIAMSAGTIIACSCKSILMGKTSNLGPIDPQMGPHPAIAIKAQFEKAYSDIIANPRSAEVWRPLLAALGPSILQQCDGVIKWASEFVEESLKSNMYAGKADAEELAKKATLTLTQEGHYGHSKHFHIGECEAMGLNIEKLEGDQTLQELVLTIHHTYMHTLEILNAFKIIENNLGNGITKIAAR